MSDADRIEGEVIHPFCPEHIVIATNLESGGNVKSDDLRCAYESTTACEDILPDCPFRATIQVAAIRRGLKTS